MAYKILEVPYFTQPTSITCQSTCLKMYACYLAQQQAISHVTQGLAISDIWHEINKSDERPSKDRNAYQNMAWWLNKYFPYYKFSVRKTTNTDEAIAYVVTRINNGFPVMVSTNHLRTDGHIILVVGYNNFFSDQSSEVEFICHDPYGKFNPQSGSNDYGKRRYSKGMSLAMGGEIGPGKAVTYNHQGIRRIRSDKHSAHTYFLISGTS